MSLILLRVHISDLLVSVLNTAEWCIARLSHRIRLPDVQSSLSRLQKLQGVEVAVDRECGRRLRRCQTYRLFLIEDLRRVHRCPVALLLPGVSQRRRIAQNYRGAHVNFGQADIAFEIV